MANWTKADHTRLINAMAPLACGYWWDEEGITHMELGDEEVRAATAQFVHELSSNSPYWRRFAEDWEYAELTGDYSGVDLDTEIVDCIVQFAHIGEIHYG